jgi:hypothetical protein
MESVISPFAFKAQHVGRSVHFDFVPKDKEVVFVAAVRGADGYEPLKSSLLMGIWALDVVHKSMPAGKKARLPKDDTEHQALIAEILPN